MTEANPSSSFFFNYWRDACERSVLFLDIMRRRGNDYLVQSARTAPHVLNFEAEVLVDGRTLPKPVNYALVRIVPPADVMIDPNKRPFIVFDPRAGHGPGIGGMKHDSEIGVALARRPSLLFRRLSAASGARPDDRGHLPRGGAFRQSRH